jgi:hypothetical protein
MTSCSAPRASTCCCIWPQTAPTPAATRELLVLDRAEGIHVVDTAGQRLAHQVA